MAGVGKVATKFREKFSYVHKEAMQWFPGHMGKGLKQMNQQLKNVDCIIEVHDARIPLTGRFTEYRNTICGLKPHIYVLNKKDLADLSQSKAIRAELKQVGLEHVVYTNFRDHQCTGMKKLLPLATRLIMESNRYNRSENEDFGIMVIGVPNVGKSSLINKLRNKYMKKKNATAVGAVPGITRSVLTRIKISEKPPVYVLDTPGILEPQVRSIETGLKLAAVCCLQDHLVGIQTIADFVLFWLNQQQRFEYVQVLGLSKPTDDILEILTVIAVKKDKQLKLKGMDGRAIIRPDYRFAAEYFLKLFRTGEMGPVMLDNDLLGAKQN